MKLEQTLEFNVEQVYYTSDLCLAATLKCSGCVIIKWEEKNGKFTFYFNRDTQADKTIKDYFSLPTEKHPFKKFYNEMKEIKNLIYNS